ncbi:MAG: hypothetical protein ACJASB_001070 [Shewanella psychromarinicola]|jgi:hypothetical protein
MYPLMSKMPSRLCGDEIIIVTTNCHIIESWLFEAQNRVKNLLALGNYY